MKFSWILLLLVLLVSCANVDDLIEAGRYEQAITKGIQKLEKTPNDPVIVNQILQAYQLANKRDLDRIVILKDLEESPSNWHRIYNLYKSMVDREQQIESAKIEIPEKIRAKISMELLESKEKTCLLYQNNAEQLMLNNVRTDYKKSYAIWNTLGKLNCGIENVDSLMSMCLQKGRAEVVVYLTNQRNVTIPYDTELKLTSFPYQSNNKLGPWINFSNNYRSSNRVDYTIQLTFNQVNVSHNKSSFSYQNEEKKVVDKYVYKTDENGKKTKTAVYKTVKVKVKRIKLEKSSSQGLLFTIIDNAKQRVVYEQQLVGKAYFEYTYGTYSGDARALTKSQQNLVKRKARAYPSNSSMIKSSGKDLYKRTYNLIYTQRKRFV